MNTIIDLITEKVLQNFWKKVNKRSDNECWEWIGAKVRGGYGSSSIQKRLFQAHRLSWIIHNGEIPKGMLVCHTCDNPPCVNPSHLFLGTHLDNAKDRVLKNRQARGDHWGKELKYPFDLIIKIRTIYETENISMHEISRRFNITYSHVNAILHRRVRNVG